jgi:sigma-B regulation protein RsbU (phosphoserine phosphatase)
MTNSKILIVDDEPFNVDYLEQELEESDYKIISAVNGREGLDKVQAELPDLILLDIMMPVVDGFEMLKCLKANSATRDIPVIVISANSDLGSVVKGIQLGAEDYLPKPFEPILLHARISSSLEKKRLRDLEHLYLKGLEREMEIGHIIQRGFLPSEFPVVPGWEIAAYFKAAREVAGDFYDAFLLPDGNLICVVGDVCDKGVGAALFMTLFRSLIRITSTTDVFNGGNKTNVLTPSERLRHVVSFTNNYIAETHCEANMFATIFVGILNLQDGTLTYVNAGNENPLIVRAGNVVAELQATGPVVGLFTEAKFTVKNTLIEKDDLLVAFTDGILDARNSADESYGHEHLRSLLNAGGAGPDKLLKCIGEQVHQFIGAARQFDDITLLAVKRNS